VLLLLMAAVMAHWLDCSPVWLMLVGPPASAKTELITLFKGVGHVVFLSDLSPNTLASGFNVRADRADPSLLDKLTDNVLAVKEFTTVLAKRAEARGEILAQLREVYDGVFNKAWGTGKQMDWQGRVSLIGGVTDEIDRMHSVMASLGPRFLFIRIRQPDRKAVARRALTNRKVGDAQKEAQRAVADLFKSMKPRAGKVIDLPTTPVDVEQRLIDVAEFVTRARSVVHKTEDGESEFAPPPEAPGRFVRQLHGLAAGLAAVEGRSEVSMTDVERVERVAMDCLPPVRRLIIDAMRDVDTALTVSDLVRATGRRVSDKTLRREVQALTQLGTVVPWEGGHMLG